MTSYPLLWKPTAAVALATGFTEWFDTLDSEGGPPQQPMLYSTPDSVELREKLGSNRRGCVPHQAAARRTCITL